MHDLPQSLLAHLQREARDARVRANASREENEEQNGESTGRNSDALSMFEVEAWRRSVMEMMLIYRKAGETIASNKRPS
jgi:hypothetical protein